MDKIIDNSKTDKNTVHSYTQVYEELFNKKRLTANKVMEIGVQRGGSIKLWNNYFQNAVIYGLEISKNINSYLKKVIENKNIRYINGIDAYNKKFYSSFISENKNSFDIVIDDGPHTLESMIIFVEKYIDLLKEDGILVVEDVAKIEWIDILKKFIKEEDKKFIKVYDRRNIKGRFDDILFVVDKGSN